LAADTSDRSHPSSRRPRRSGVYPRHREGPEALAFTPVIAKDPKVGAAHLRHREGPEVLAWTEAIPPERSATAGRIAPVTKDAAWPKARRRPALRAALALRGGGAMDLGRFSRAALWSEGRASSSQKGFHHDSHRHSRCILRARGFVAPLSPAFSDRRRIRKPKGTPNETNLSDVMDTTRRMDLPQVGAPGRRTRAFCAPRTIRRSIWRRRDTT
jgi:hypothetical protein